MHDYLFCTVRTYIWLKKKHPKNLPFFFYYKTVARFRKKKL